MTHTVKIEAIVEGTETMADALDFADRHIPELSKDGELGIRMETKITGAVVSDDGT